MNDLAPKSHTQEETNKLNKNLASPDKKKGLCPQKDHDEEFILSSPEKLEKSVEDLEDQDCIILRDGENKPKSVGNISDESFDISEKGLDVQEDPQTNEQDPQEILSFSDKESMDTSIIKEEGELNVNKSDKILELSSKMPPMLQGKILEFLLPGDRDDKVEQASQTDYEKVTRCAEQSVQTLNLTFEKLGKDQVMQTDTNTLQNKDEASQSEESIILNEKATAKLCSDIATEDRKQSQEKDRIENLVIKAVQSNLPEFASLVRSYIEHPPFEQEKPEVQFTRKSSVHNFCYCDGCGMRPLVGTRYRCSICDDFDFCERCESTKEHPHLFFKIKTPEDFTKLDQHDRRYSFGDQTRSELKLKNIGTKIKESTLGKVFSGVFEHLFSGNPKPIIIESQDSPREEEQ